MFQLVGHQPRTGVDTEMGNHTSDWCRREARILMSLYNMAIVVYSEPAQYMSLQSLISNTTPEIEGRYGRHSELTINESQARLVEDSEPSHLEDPYSDDG